MFMGKARAYPTEECLKGASLGQALTLLTNIILGWKGMLGTKTLANYGRQEKVFQHWLLVRILSKVILDTI
jgi:hypothetical protein